MITFELTKNVDLVRQIVTHPMIYGPGSDDFSPDAQDWHAPQKEGILYVLALEDDAPIGIFILIAISPIYWRLDVGFLPIAWGWAAAAAGKAFVPWLWENTSCQRIIGEIPACNPKAVRYGSLLGMKKYGENPDSFLKRGKLYSHVLMGISRPKERVSCLQ